MVVGCIPCAAAVAPTVVTSLGGILTTSAAALAGAFGAKNLSNKIKRSKKKKTKKKNQTGGRRRRKYQKGGRTRKKTFKTRQRGGKHHKPLRRSFSRVYIEHI